MTEALPLENPQASPARDEERSVDALMAQARRLYRAKRYVDAADCAKEAIERAPDQPELWNARGVFLRAGRQAADAVWCYRGALALDPTNAAYWSNLGNALKDTKQVAAAVECQCRAIELAPGHFEYRENLALALMAGNRHEEAVQAFGEAMKLKPDSSALRFNRAMAYLHLGDCGRGFVDYEMRLKNRENERVLPGSPWKGRSYAGRRLLVAAEQGLGDAIWASRYFRHVKALGGELIVECHEPLLPLFARMPAIDRTVRLGDPLPEAEFHCHLCSLPGLFTRDLSGIPSEPYIAVPEDRLGKFDGVVEQAGEALRVGIVWSGNLQFIRNKDRAVPLQAFMQALAFPGVQLYSLQKGLLEKDLKTLTKDAPIIDLAPLIGDFLDTAAAISRLDLVIMTDSSVAHLCGAMGKPIWLLLSYVSFWMWLLEREDSPWYPSMRLFRQRAWGDWGGVFDAATAELLRLLLAKARGQRTSDAVADRSAVARPRD